MAMDTVPNAGQPAAQRAGRKATLFWGRIAGVALCIGIAILFMVPFLWTISTSLKDPRDVYVFPPQWIPATIKWDNYPEVWQRSPYLTWLWNSAVVTILATVGQVISSTVVAYGFARYRFRGRDLLFALTMATLILPREVTLIPTFLLFKNIGWLDKLQSLIIPNWFGTPSSAFYIFLMRQFFLALPREMEEAARVDGAGVMRILLSVVAPLSTPALATTAILAFLHHWNEFLEPLIFLSSTNKFTVAVGIRFFQVSTPDSGIPKEPLLMAASLMMTVPCIALFFLGQRYFVRGVVMSGLKG